MCNSLNHLFPDRLIFFTEFHYLYIVSDNSVGFHFICCLLSPYITHNDFHHPPLSHEPASQNVAFWVNEASLVKSLHILKLTFHNEYHSG